MSSSPSAHSWPQPPIHIPLSHPSPHITLYLRTPHPPASPSTLSPDAYHLSTIFADLANTFQEPEKYNVHIEKWLAAAAAGGSCFMLVCLRQRPETRQLRFPESAGAPAEDGAEEKVIGFGGIKRIATRIDNRDKDERTRIANLGLLMHTTYHDKGYGEAAYKGIIKAACEQWGIDEWFPEKFTSHKPYRALMKAAGLEELESKSRSGIISGKVDDKGV